MEISSIHMETYANWSLKLHNYISKAGGDCATNHCSAATVMTLAGGAFAWCSGAEEIIKAGGASGLLHTVRHQLKSRNGQETCV